MRPQISNVIKNFNIDFAEATKDGLTMIEALSIAGAISETALKNIAPAERSRCWQAVIDIMAKRFEAGAL